VNERVFVVDSSALIFLSKIESLPLLSRLATKVVVPASVHREVLAGKHHQLVGIGSLAWLRLEPDILLPAEIASWGLGDGESQVLAHAVSVAWSEAVVDDLQARQCARTLGIAFTGTAGVILRAKLNGSIPAARPLLEELLRVGMYLSGNLVETMLAEVGE
jgi:predicted nucleic acid-binding protein